MERPKYVSLCFIDNATVKIEKGEIEELNNESYYNIPNEEVFVKESEVPTFVGEISTELDLTIFKVNKWIIEFEYWPNGVRVYIIDEMSSGIVFTGDNLASIIADKIMPYVEQRNIYNI